MDATYTFDELKDEKLANLMKLALEVRQRAYAPYSKFLVGAAVHTTDGRTFTGCNVENASYGLGVCAEVVAISKAISEGATELEVLVVAADAPKGQFTSPCGRCRQFIAEFVVTMDMKVYMLHIDGTYKIASVKEILPMAFTPKLLRETTSAK